MSSPTLARVSCGVLKRCGGQAALQASRVPLPSRHSYAMLGELKGLLAIPSGGIADMAKTKADHQVEAGHAQVMMNE